jgi:hypothetical protein
MIVLITLVSSPIYTDLEDSREVDLRGLSSFNEAITGTQECALGERA